MPCFRAQRVVFLDADQAAARRAAGLVFGRGVGGHKIDLAFAVFGRARGASVVAPAGGGNPPVGPFYLIP